MDKLQTYANKTIEFLFYGLFFFTPLLLWPKTSEVFEFNKMLFVYLMTALIVAAWAVKSVAQGHFRVRRTPLDLPILLFFLSQVLSTIFSIDVHTSIWGYYSRFHGGLASTIVYILLYYALVTNFTPLETIIEKAKKKIIKQPLDSHVRVSYLVYSIIASASLVSIYGCLEHLGIDKNLWIQDVQSRVFSTLGQPNWLSAFLVGTLPLSLYLYLFAKKTPGKIIYATLTYLFLLTTLFTKSRSGIGTAFLLVVAVAVFEFIKRRHRRDVILFLIPVVLGTFLVGTPWSPNPADLASRLKIGGPLWPEAEKYLNKVHLTTQIKPLDLSQLPKDQAQTIKDRAAGIRVGGSDSFAIREVVWQGAVALGQKYPLFGTGVETFGYSYYWVRPTTHNLLSEWEFLYNKAHNEYLNLMANTGFVGLGTYLFLIMVISIWFFKRLRTAHTNDKETPLLLGLAAGWASVLITNYFGFSVVNIALIFFLYPALALVIGEKSSHYFQIKFNLNPVYAVPVIVGLALYFVMIPINQWRADLAYNLGRIYSQSNYVKEAQSQLQTAIALEPKEPSFYAQLGETDAIIATAIQQQYSALPASDAAKYKDLAAQTVAQYEKDSLNNLDKALELNPWQTNFYKTKAKAELYLGIIDPKYNQEALETLLKLSELAPTDAKIFYNLGLIYETLKQSDKAQTMFKKALELKPDYDAAKSLIKN